MKLKDNFQIREHSWPCLFHMNMDMDRDMNVNEHEELSNITHLDSIIKIRSLIAPGFV